MSESIQLSPELLAQLPGELREVLLALVAQFTAQLQALQQENQLLRQKLDALIRRYFGNHKNEAIDPQQMLLLLAGLTDEQPAIPPQKTTPKDATTSQTKRAPARSGIPQNLPIQETVLIPTEVQAHPDAWRQIDQEVTKVLDYEPGRFFWQQIVRPKYVRANRSTPEPPKASAPTQKIPAMAVAAALASIEDPPEVLMASLPNRLIEKGLPGVGLLVYLILSRFEDHLPYYRMEKIIRERHRIPIARQSMVDWTEQIATWLLPIYRQMIQGLKATEYLQADETPIRYLDREEPGRSYKGYFWVYHHPGGDVIFDWHTSRGRDGPQEFLKGYQGLLQTDGYQVYGALAGEDPKLTLLACWAHVRRKFFEAKDHDRRTAWFLHQIGLLYQLERRLRESQAGPALRQAARAAEAKLILGRLKKGQEKIQPKLLPQSLLGQALDYMRKLWPALNRYTEYGQAEIDNNSVENKIRPTAIGKKNFLFIGHPDAGWRSAVIYSIMGSCRSRGIDPAQYLKDILTRLPDMKQCEIPQVTPAAWAKSHPEAKIALPK